MVLHANWAYMLPTVLVDAESALVLLKKSFVCLPYVSFQKQKEENQEKEKKDAIHLRRKASGTRARTKEKFSIWCIASHGECSCRGGVAMAAPYS